MRKQVLGFHSRIGSRMATTTLPSLYNETGSFDMDVLRKIEYYIKSEWEGDKPGINFFLLLFALFSFIVWMVFILFFFSRLFGLFLGYWMRRFLAWSGVDDIVQLSIGSFSVSILSGKIMFRDFLLVTGDFTLRLNDGWIIFSYWKYISKDRRIQDCMNVSRLHILVNGLKIHVFNRMSVYQNIARQAGMQHLFNTVNLKEPAFGGTTKTTKNNSAMLEMQLDAWWDNLWRLFGAIRLEVTSARLLAGNNLLPTVCSFTFENLKSRIFLSEASNKDDDRYMLRLEASAENLKVALIKSNDFIGSDISSVKQEDPPRTMGNGFVIFQSAMIQFYYHQDLLGLVKDERQSSNLKVPVWETIWRLDKNTIFSYGPWADKQRALIYTFFFPSDCGCAPLTEMPRRGERRILINHNVRVSLLHDATIDFWFMRNEELNAIHSRVKQGSSLEFYIPFVITEKGFISNLSGCLLCFESTTSLPFREFINCETFRFNVTMNYPRSYNHQQVWDICIVLHEFSTYFLWDHKNFVMDIINEWNSDNVPDLCKFIPCLWNINIKVVDRFEILLLLNDKNWIDTISTQLPENLQVAITSEHLYVNYTLDFTEFQPDLNTFELNMKAEHDITVRVYIPPQNLLASVFAAIIHNSSQACRETSKANKKMRTGSSISTDSDGKSWFKILTTELITLKCEYEYYALIKHLTTDLPAHYIQYWLPTAPSNPFTLEPDNLFIEVNIQESELLLSGLFVKLVLNFKDNYFSAYDKASDVATKPLHSANTTINMNENDVFHYRTMNTFFKLKLFNIFGHCLTHNYLEDEADASKKNFCPVVMVDELVIELKKTHLEFVVQVATTPITLKFPEKEKVLKNTTQSVMISGVQFRGHSLCSDFEVPWSAEVLEYGWLVEVIIGDIIGRIKICDLLKFMQFINSAIITLLPGDDEMEMPERSNLCHHFQNICFCSKSNLNLIDNRHRLQKCASVETLKYKCIRVSVDSLKIFLDEEIYGHQICIKQIRFAFCNSHCGTFAENFKLHIGRTDANQFIRLENNTGNWARCGYAIANNLEFNLHLAYSPAERYLIEERRKFLLKHDKASDCRLYFLWNKEYAKSCTCFGRSRFFAEEDTSGIQFFSSNDETNKLAVPFIHCNNNEQPAYLQSILDAQCLALPGQENQKKSTVSISADDDENDSPRKVSDASFHSATSRRFFTGMLFPLFDVNVAEYVNFLDVFHFFDEDLTFKRICNGISGVRLVHKNDNSTSISSQLEVNEHEKNVEVCDYNTFDLNVGGGKHVEVFLSIISLELLEKFVATISDALCRQNPAYLAEHIYRNCSMAHHKQPLTSSFKRKESSLLDCNLNAIIELPLLDICFLKCGHSNLTRSTNKYNSLSSINSIALAQIQPCSVKIMPPSSLCSVMAGNSDYKQSKAFVNFQLTNTYFDILHIVDQKEYDSVFNKIPISVTTNWADITTNIEEFHDMRVKTIIDIHLPQITVNGAIGKVLNKPIDKKTKSSAKICMGNRLTVDMQSFNIVAVLGKSIEDPPLHTNNNAFVKPSEHSFFEALSPIISAWCKAILKCEKNVLRVYEMTEMHRILTVTKLLSDALDWQDDCAFVDLSLQSNRMQDVKLYYRNLLSCPSCRLIHNLLHYAARNEKYIRLNYFTDISINLNIFANKERCKAAVIALLSHWQTVICNEIQLADNKLAHKYKYNVPLKSYIISENTNSGDASNSNGNRIMSDIQNKNQQAQTSRNADADDASSRVAPFRPTHRRGPSTLTQLTQSGANENEPQDLYHWILKAHKDYKERRMQFSSDKVSDSNDTEINSMELLLSVFFWTIYQEMALENSVLDALPSKNILANITFALHDLRVAVVEKKFLVSQHNEVLVALSSHQLLTLDNFEATIRLGFETKLDDYQLRPAWGNLELDYSCKIQEIRLVVSLASVFFINDLTLLIRFLHNDVDNFLQKLQLCKKIRSIHPSTTSPLDKAEGEKEDRRAASWPNGVINKLLDYERSLPYKRRDFLHVKTIGNWALKIVAFESMIIDLFISLTLLKLQFNQRHTRLVSSSKPPANNGNNNITSTIFSANNSHNRRKISRINDNFAIDQEIKDLYYILSNSNRETCEFLHTGISAASFSTFPPPVSSVIPLTLDHLNVTLRRANLIVAEHIVTRQRNSDTHQILNCTLRESTLLYQRLVEQFCLSVPVDFSDSSIVNKLNLSLGELEADLPMHAQSIHEMVLRHGPQLNEQFHRIVGQPQLITFENVASATKPSFVAIEQQSLASSSPDEYFNAMSQSHSATTTSSLVGDINETLAGDRLPRILSTAEDEKALPSLSTSVSPPIPLTSIMKPKQAPLEIEFSLQLAGIELNAKLLSSLKAKYKMQKAIGKGRSGKISDFCAEISDHHLSFQVTARDEVGSNNAAMPIDTFTLQLPQISANGAYRIKPKNESDEPNISANSNANNNKESTFMWFDGWSNAELIYQDGNYYDITIFMGPMIHTFSTDLLNQILFAEQSFRSELSFLIDRLSSERPKTPSGTSFLSMNPILFNLEIKGNGIPWLQITATTPTSIAIRFTIDSPHAVFTNRFIRDPVFNSSRCGDGMKIVAEAILGDHNIDHRLFGQGKIQLNVKLGQLYKTALYEETQEELEEYANFMTQINIHNEDSIITNAIHAFSILLNRPFLLIKSNAIDKAILLWLNYRNTYNYWRKEREKLLRTHRSFETTSQQSEKATRQTAYSTTATNFTTDMNINLSLSIRNGLYVCMPLYSPEPTDNFAALMLSLQRSDITVCVKKELACNATFNAFKVTFIDNFDEQILSEPWLYESGSNAATHSNYFFFPHGSYNFCTSAVSPNIENRNAKWILSVKSHMQGMVIDFDYKIGKLTNLLIQTLTSSFALDDDDEMVDDDYVPSDSSYALIAIDDDCQPKVDVVLNRSHATTTQSASIAMSDNNDSDRAPLHSSNTADDDRLTGGRASLDGVDPQHSTFVRQLPADSEVDEEELAGDFGTGHENRARALERKMHEQSVLVTDLMNLGASEFAIEKERRKLRILELARFKHFRQSMWDKVRQKMDHHQQLQQHQDSSDVSKLTMAAAGRRSGAPSSASHKGHRRQSSRTFAQTINDSNAMSTDINADNDVNKTASQPPTESVDMNIDVQINIECGQCILRANQPSSHPTTQRSILTKKPSARDLKNKTLLSINTPQAVTKLSIPSLNSNIFYTSNDPIAKPPAFVHEFFQENLQSNRSTDKNKCFYMTLELASMPLETSITPSLADFLEQVIEPLPESLFEASAKSPTAISTPGDRSTMPIVAIDASSLPLDVLFYMSVQSSAIRFESQQQRSSAADCLLTLPGLILTASTRKSNDAPEHSFLGGIYLSATLSSFSLSVYSPHQQSSAHDAFSLTLDRFSITASRSKNLLHKDDDRNRVELVILSNVGSANLNYDMRRLSELLTFPRPWYRKQLIRRLFFGEQSLSANTANRQGVNNTTTMYNFNDSGIRRASDNDDDDSHRLTSKFNVFRRASLNEEDTYRHKQLSHASPAATRNEREWAASVVFSMQWKELNVNAQMSSTMGNTVWLARNGSFRGNLQLDSKRDRDISMTFKLDASELNAHGGAISGQASISQLLITAQHKKRNGYAPENEATIQVDSVESRIEWMSCCIFIGRFLMPKILIVDEWKSTFNDSGEVSEASCLINIGGSWQDLQMIITKNTVSDMIKIGQKLIYFFKDQLKSSRLAWDQEFFDTMDGYSSTSSEELPPIFSDPMLSRSNLTKDKSNKYPIRHLSFVSLYSTGSLESGSEKDGMRGDDSMTTTHWQKVLDLLLDIQLRHKFLRLPTTNDGVTFAGGNIELRAERISVSCMNGEMNASSWALFHMNEVGMLFNGRSSYTFLNSAKDAEQSNEENPNIGGDIGIRIRQRFTFMLGEGREKLRLFPSQSTSQDLVTSEKIQTRNTTSNAVVYRVQHRGFLMRHNASIDYLLTMMIGDVIKQHLESKANQTSGEKTLAKAGSSSQHNVLRLFIFPALEAVLDTTQHRELYEAARRRKRYRNKNAQDANVRRSDVNDAGPIVNTVTSTFVCKFHDAVCVQTDFNAQVSFLPELLKSYKISQPDNSTDPSLRHGAVSPSVSAVALSGSNASHHLHSSVAPSSPSMAFLNVKSSTTSSPKDPRIYVCIEWVVDPKIMFIDRFKWNPPVIDEVLKKLQIFDHRQTIPKVLQRGLLDRCDLLIAAIEQVLIRQSEKK